MKKQNKKEPNYKAIFFLGITFIGAGVVFISAVNAGLGGAFIGLGALYMIIGGKNRDKWPKK
jgi:hypothetical protein